MRSLHSEDTRSSGLTAGFALNEPLLHSSEVARLEAELGGNDASFAEALWPRARASVDHFAVLFSASGQDDP